MSKKQLTSFGERIKQLRVKQKLSQRKVAALLNIDNSLLAKYERNERQPSRVLIIKIAEIYKADSNELINEALTDKIAYQILEEEADSKILRVAETKVKYLKNQKSSNT